MSLAGRTIYHLWHRPLAAVRHSYRHGGPLAQMRMARGEHAMRAAALALPPLPQRPADRSPLSVHFLTGRRFMHQTAFCLHSLARVSPVPITAEIYDDGTLDSASLDLLHRIAPAARIHNFNVLRDRLDQFLPDSRFPVLRDRWRNYPHIRKVIDIHLGREGWRLVLDSDLLFWREPTFILDWAAVPDRPLHAVDCAENYGYSRPLLEKVAGASIPPLVNVGLCGFRSESIDWDYLEHAAATLIAAEGTSYYLEQGLVAVLVARVGRAAIAPRADYVTFPSSDEIRRPSAVMHHYVDTSRGDYYRVAWRELLAQT